MIGPGRRSKSSHARQAGVPDAHDAAVSGEGSFAAEALEPPLAHATPLTTSTAPMAVEQRVRKAIPGWGAIIARRVHAVLSSAGLNADPEDGASDQGSERACSSDEEESRERALAISRELNGPGIRHSGRRFLVNIDSREPTLPTAPSGSPVMARFIPHLRRAQPSATDPPDTEEARGSPPLAPTTMDQRIWPFIYRGLDGHPNGRRPVRVPPAARVVGTRAGRRSGSQSRTPTARRLDIGTRWPLPPRTDDPRRCSGQG